MQGVLLAAGRGSRMGGLTDDRPKCMVELAGRPLLVRLLASLRGAGISPLGAVRGWRGERLESLGIELFDNPHWAETNMVASLTCAADWLRRDACLVSYTDIVYHPEAAQTLAAAAGDLVVAYDPDWLRLWSRRFADPLSDAETFQVDNAGRVTDIGRRPRDLDEVRGQYMGLLKFTPTGWALVEKTLAALPVERRQRLDMTSLLRLLIDGGAEVRAVPIASHWIEADSAEDLALYEAMLADGSLVLPGVP